MLAVGGAVINRPEQMPRDCGEHIPDKSLSAVQEETAGKKRGRNVQEEHRAAQNAKDTALIETSERQDVNKTAVIDISLHRTQIVHAADRVDRFQVPVLAQRLEESG
jgi:hypothetical protein